MDLNAVWTVPTKSMLCFCSAADALLQLMM